MQPVERVGPAHQVRDAKHRSRGPDGGSDGGAADRHDEPVAFPVVLGLRRPAIVHPQLEARDLQVGWAEGVGVGGDNQCGHSQAKTPAVRSAQISPSTVALIVVIQERRYQIDIGHRASVYATNAVRPAKWTAARELAPGGNALPATSAAKIPTTTEKRNHWMRFFPMAIEPPGMTVNIMTGPFLNFSTNAGDRICSVLSGRGIM